MELGRARDAKLPILAANYSGGDHCREVDPLADPAAIGDAAPGPAGLRRLSGAGDADRCAAATAAHADPRTPTDGRARPPRRPRGPSPLPRSPRHRQRRSPLRDRRLVKRGREPRRRERARHSPAPRQSWSGGSAGDDRHGDRRPTTADNYTWWKVDTAGSWAAGCAAGPENDPWLIPCSQRNRPANRWHGSWSIAPSSWATASR